MKRNIKILSLLMAVLLAFSVFPFSTAYAVEGTETVETQKTEKFTLPDIVPEEEAVERGYIGRVKEEEKDNYTFVFKDSENMRTMRVYSHPVKYTDKDGNTKDITLDIQSRPGGGFETKDNSIKTTFGAKLSDGIRLQSEDVDIKLIPANSLNRATLSEDNKTVSYTLDAKTTLEYSLTYTGFKEDIVVNEYTGQTEYEFLLYTNGLTVKEEMGSFYLADSVGTRKANIGDIIIFTADERNNTLGELSCEEIKPNYAYLLTIHVDAEYLKDEKTVYPIRIDPTFEITSAMPAGAIEDVTVYTGTSYYSGTLGILYLGTSNNHKYRIMMRFPNLEIPVVFPEMIVSASVELRDVMCQGVHVDVECRYYSGSATAWSESTTTTWNSVNPDYYGELLDTQTIFYGNGNVPGIPQRYSFDITGAAKSWAIGSHSPQRGLVFKAKDESFSSTEDRLKYFGSINRSDYQPSFTLKYRTHAVYTISNNSKYLTASETGLSKATMATASSPEYDGNTMWCIEYNTYQDSYQLISMGIKVYNGTRYATVFSSSSGVGVGDVYMYMTQTLFDAICISKGCYVFQARDTGKYLYVNSSNTLTQTSTQSSATVFTLNSIETESFNNFWSGSYSRGIYNGVAHIKIVLDSSITDSDRYRGIDFSSAKLWNSITEHIIIYGPGDALPAGITPFVVTFKTANLPVEYDVNMTEITGFTTGLTVPNGLTRNEFSSLTLEEQENLLSSDWNSVTIYLTSSADAYADHTNYEREQQIRATIAHEMGHALKLQHPYEDDFVHLFEQSHGVFGKNTVYAIMNAGNMFNANMSAAVPQAFDIINLISKWEYHTNCNH